MESGECRLWQTVLQDATEGQEVTEGQGRGPLGKPLTQLECAVGGAE